MLRFLPAEPGCPGKSAAPWLGFIHRWIWGSQRVRLFMSERLAPLGDPIEVTVGGYELSLRKDSDKILVE